MGEINETGHAMNVANFFKLTTYCQGYGRKYMPTNPHLQIENLRLLGDNAKSLSGIVNEMLAPRDAARTARALAFKPLSPLATRLLNAIKASTTDSKVDDNIKTYVRKIKGERASDKIEVAKVAGVESTDETNQQSSSQLDFNNRLNFLDILIKQLAFIPEYAPNELELKVASLQAMYNDLSAKNTAAVETEVNIDNARIARDKVMYAPLTGLVDVALDTKTYVKSVFGPTSVEYKQISGLKFSPNKK
jgi:hypothetical protein